MLRKTYYMQLIKRVNVSPIVELITLSSQRNRQILLDCICVLNFAFRIQVNRSQRRRRRREKDTYAYTHRRGC